MMGLTTAPPIYLAMVAFSMVNLAVSEYGGRSECQIKALSSDHYVKAFSESVSPASGCDSNETSSEGFQIHALHLRGSYSHGNNVALSIAPFATNGTYEGKLLFVLASDQPVSWLIDTQRISNRSRLIFILSLGSRLRKKPSISLRVKKVALPSARGELMNWCRDREGALSTYTELTRAARVVKLLGMEDAHTPARCVLRDNYQSQSVFGYYESPQDLRGCLARWNEGYGKKCVHVIEINGAPLGTYPHKPRPSTVTLEVTANNWTGNEQHLVLILKSHSEVTFKVTTSARIQGALDIITDQNVDASGVSMEPLREGVEALHSKSGLMLMDWVAGTYGRPVSYSSLDRVDRVVLTLDGGDKLPPYSPHPELGSMNILMKEAMTVECKTGQMVVSLQKAHLQRSGLGHLASSRVSLMDRACSAVENATHLMLHAPIHGCKTLQLPTGDASLKTYSNKVILHNDDVREDDWIMSGSGVGFEESTLVDDEDYRQSSISSPAAAVPFTCQYPDPSRGNRPGVTLDLYRDEAYDQPYVYTPVEIINGQTVYVEANVIGDPNLRVMVRDCWMHPVSPLGLHHERHNIISDGCIEETTASWLDDPGLPQMENYGIPRRFRFDLLKYWDGVYNMDMSCHLALCSRTNLNGQNEPPLCMTQKRFCLIQRMHNGSWPSQWSRTLRQGELILIQKYLETNGILSHVTSTPVEPETQPQKKCEDVINVEGLDSGTVVGIAFAAFIIGVLLTGALWYIHTHTGPIMKRGHRPRSAETSGESTPSSTAPITIHHIHHH